MFFECFTIATCLWNNILALSCGSFTCSFKPPKSRSSEHHVPLLIVITLLCNKKLRPKSPTKSLFISCLYFQPENDSVKLKYVVHYVCYNSFIHLVVCLTTGPKPLPNRVLHIVRSRASSFNCEYPLLSLRSSSSFLRFLPRLPVTYIPPSIFPSIARCRRQFLLRMWPIQLAFRFLILCRIFLCSLTLSNTSSFLTWSVQLIFSILLQHHI